MTTSTSLEAHTDQELSGRAESNRQRCVELVKRHPDSTAVELAALDGYALNRHEYSRRLPEVEKLGLIRKNIKRHCRVNGSRMWTWVATEADEQ